jgi:hypothetical protein
MHQGANSIPLQIRGATYLYSRRRYPKCPLFRSVSCGLNALCLARSCLGGDMGQSVISDCYATRGLLHSTCRASPSGSALFNYGPTQPVLQPYDPGCDNCSASGPIGSMTRHSRQIEADLGWRDVVLNRDCLPPHRPARLADLRDALVHCTAWVVELIRPCEWTLHLADARDCRTARSTSQILVCKSPVFVLQS